MPGHGEQEVLRILRISKKRVQEENKINKWAKDISLLQQTCAFVLLWLVGLVA